jgi:hypothetical protein
MHPISFPGLNLWNLYVPTDIANFGNFRITWYGVLIAAGLLLAMFYAMKRAHEFNVSTDDFTDVLIFALIFGIIGARAYYIIFDPNRSSDFTSFLSMLQIWNGGLGIYGGIIVSFITAYRRLPGDQEDKLRRRFRSRRARLPHRPVHRPLGQLLSTRKPTAASPISRGG